MTITEKHKVDKSLIENDAVKTDVVQANIVQKNIVKKNTVKKNIAEKTTVEKLHITLRAFDPDRDCKLLHQWVTQPYAAFWGMQDATLDEVHEAYFALDRSAHDQVYLGYCNGRPGFLLESYDPGYSALKEHYAVESGDKGMHILLAPRSVDLPEISGFSMQVMMFAMAFLFDTEEVDRIVVEPDHRNDKIHRLNKRVGFFHTRKIQLPDKTALLGFCTYQQFLYAQRYQSMRKPVGSKSENLNDSLLSVLQPQTASTALTSTCLQHANRWLVRKAIAEFSHEKILIPQPLSDIRADQNTQYQLLSDDGKTSYEFSARIMALNHWSVDSESVTRVCESVERSVSAVEFILDFRQSLGIPEDKLSIYIEEISSTLYSHMFKQNKHTLSAKALASADFQTIETSMMEGHPCFIANSGRIGFDTRDLLSYAPEAQVSTRLIWLGAHRQRAEFSADPSLDYETLVNAELDAATRESFSNQLRDMMLDPSDYLLIPVHPWQWFNKLSIVFSADIAEKYLVCLGYGDEHYLAQQSVRTFYNVSQPNRYYVKTALSVLNMGFTRGLSADYMRSTPAINHWLYQLVSQDKTLQASGFTVLKELAAAGYRLPAYEKERMGDNPFRKMLAALWRENPSAQLTRHERLMTMASLLHVDPQGNALIAGLIDASGMTVDHWMARYLDAYLVPIIHCFYRYKLVFMPHGENVILALENHVPRRIFMKDIGEEIYLQNSDLQVPPLVERILIDMPEEMELLAIFTDVFDCYFRFLAEILNRHCNYAETAFWSQVANCIKRYQAQHPELAERFEKYDVFAPTFALSCLNRLQLKNNLQMVDLTDPASALQLVGHLENPIALFKPGSSESR